MPHIQVGEYAYPPSGIHAAPLTPDPRPAFFLIGPVLDGKVAPAGGTDRVSRADFEIEHLTRMSWCQLAPKS